MVPCHDLSALSDRVKTQEEQVKALHYQQHMITDHMKTVARKVQILWWAMVVAWVAQAATIAYLAWRVGKN